MLIDCYLLFGCSVANVAAGFTTPMRFVGSIATADARLQIAATTRFLLSVLGHCPSPDLVSFAFLHSVLCRCEQIITRNGISRKGLYRVGMIRALHRIQYECFRGLLVKAREAAGLTQVDIAARLGKPQSYVSKCERGERRLDFTEFLEYADALELNLADFEQQYRQRVENLSPSPVQTRKAK